MIEGIKVSTSNGYLKEVKINQQVNVGETSKAKQQIDKVKVELQAKEYFYQEKKLMYSDEHDGEKVFELTLTGEQVGYFMKQGYEVDKLEDKQLEALEKNKINSRRIQNQEKESKKIARLKQHSNGMYMYAISNEGRLSINDLYKGSYTFQGSNNKYTQEQVNGVLKLNNLERTTGNQWAVEKLLSLGLEVSTGNVVKVQNIKDAVDSLPDEEKKENEYQIDPNRAIIEEEKILYIEKDIEDIIDEITEMDDGVIREALSEGKEITIGNLREILHRNTEKALGKEATQMTRDIDKTKEVKGQLNEIRGKLNTEAAIKISEKMPLESTELAKVVKELRVIEEESIEEALKKVEVQLTEEVKGIMRETLQATQRIKYQKDIVIGMEIKEEYTLEKMTKALLVYEDNALIPQKRFGETIVKVGEQIPEILEEKGIELTPVNQSVAKALITNGIEVTKENIESATKVMQKVDVFLEEMTPERAAILIKEGVNPYKASISQLVEWIGEEKLPKFKNIVAEAIVSLEERGQINDSQKQGLLGLYRIIDGVEKNKEQIVGYIFKNELPLTIEKLGEATKYVKKTEHIKVTIDDEFGEVEELKYTRETAKQMMGHSHQEVNELIDKMSGLEHRELFSEIKHPEELLKISSMIYPLIKSEIKRELGKFENESVLSSGMLEKLNAIKTVTPEVVETMNKHQIPLTLSNIYWMQKLIENPKLYGELLCQKGMNKEAFPHTLEEIQEDLEKLREYAKEKKEISADKGDVLGYRNFKQLEEVMQVQKQILQKEGLYQIPFMIDGQPKIVHLYVQDQTKVNQTEKDGILAVITYETKGLGSVVAKVHVQKDRLKVNIQSENKEITGKLRSQSQKLETMLEKVGYVIDSSEFLVEKSDNVILNPKQTVRRGESDFEVVV